MRRCKVSPQIRQKKKQKQAIPFAPNNDTSHQGRKRTKRLKRKKYLNTMKADSVTGSDRLL